MNAILSVGAVLMSSLLASGTAEAAWGRSQPSPQISACASAASASVVGSIRASSMKQFDDRASVRPSGGTARGSITDEIMQAQRKLKGR